MSELTLTKSDLQTYFPGLCFTSDDYFLEQDQKEVDSYIPYRYTSAFVAEDTERLEQYADWAKERELAVKALHLQHISGSGCSLAVTGITAVSRKAQDQTLHVSDTPAHTIASRKPATSTITTPAASNAVPPSTSLMLAVLSSQIMQPARLPSSLKRAPALSSHLQISSKKQPPPLTGISDQQTARLPAENYLIRHHNRPPHNIQWPKRIEISIVEICTFCPNWLQNPEVVARAIRNGWSREALAKAQLLAESPQSRDPFDKRCARIQQQISEAGKLIDRRPKSQRFSSDKFRIRHGSQNDLTASAWLFRDSYDPHRAKKQLGDMPLVELYANVATWPTGNDRLLMTRCLEFARDNPELKLDTSHWEWIISSQLFTTPPPLADGQHRDVEALERLNQVADPVP